MKQEKVVRNLIRNETRESCEESNTVEKVKHMKCSRKERREREQKLSLQGLKNSVLNAST